MTPSLSELDAHEQPPSELRAAWKRFSRLDAQVLLQDNRIDDPRLPLEKSGLCSIGIISIDQTARAFYLSPGAEVNARGPASVLHDPMLPGLLIIPSLIPPPIQTVLLDKMLHRDLVNPQHRTNMHLHYEIPYPIDSSEPCPSLFALPEDEPALFRPKDAAVHKPLTARQVLQRRLHWLTMGGQYDWTNRAYPVEPPPIFPPDLSRFLETLFPETLAQAAIVNLYSPGDTMMLHRDVSEEADRGLISLSLGCDGLFMIVPNSGGGGSSGDSSRSALHSDKSYLLLRLRSGDAVYMTDEARYAWHGVPKVLKDTCPPYLEAWPARDGAFDEWQCWMKHKRINLNVRQMKD